MKTAYLFLISCFLLLISCSTHEKRQEQQLSFTPPQKNNSASYFKIYKEENFSALVTYTNIEKTDSTVYVLYKNEKPSLTFNAYYIKTPVTSVACLASVFVGALSNLQLLDRIAAIDNADYICNA